MANHAEIEKKPVYKKWWFWAIIIIIIAIIATGGKRGNTQNQTIDISTVATEERQETKITLEKFNKIETGMSYEQVVEIIGEEGTTLSESNIANDEKYHTIMYSWKAKNEIANANVTFQGGKVISKAQIGLK